MNRQDAAREVKMRYAEYLKPARKKVRGQQTYICPLCGNGTGSDGDGLSIDPKGDGTQFRCFKCGFYGDIIDLYQQENSCDASTAFNSLYDYFGIEIDRNVQNSPRKPVKEDKAIKNTPKEDKEPVNEAVKDFTAYYNSCRDAIKEPAAQEYLSFRGLSADTAAAYWLGYDKKTKHLIIPCARGYYVARNTNRASKARYNNPAGASIELFNKKALYNKDGRPVFITEGAIDALSIIEAGGEAVGTNSAANWKKIIDALKEKPTNCMLILCYDNDDTGKTDGKQLAESLKDHSIPFLQADICGAYKDPNEALTAGADTFKAIISDTERKALEQWRHESKPHNTSDYITNLMGAEIEQLKAQSNRKTGFKNLDAEAGSIYAGLYAVGGISSVGKTTFISQIADQMAALGQHVLYFSMEQSRLEMVSKSIARQTAKDDPQKAVSSLQIRTGAKSEVITKAAAEYMASVGDRISIIEGNFNCDVAYIRDYARQYSERNDGVKPVIIVDYLQVIQGEKDPATGRKSTDIRQTVDHNVTELKRLSREGMPIFVISSVNRSNYLAPIDFEAFKESGGIEFTCDVCWGLQLSAIHDPVFDSEKKIKEKREVIAAAKAAMPREIELVCLKNRYGKSRYSVQFIYYPQYDYFEPVIYGEFVQSKGNSPWENAQIK